MTLPPDAPAPSADAPYDFATAVPVRSPRLGLIAMLLGVGVFVLSAAFLAPGVSLIVYFATALALA